MSAIQNKNVLVTGGASGIGYKFSEELLRNGAKCIAILDINTTAGEKAVETLQKEFGKGKVIFFTCDVSKSEEYEDCFKKVTNALGYVDILINNAGIIDDRRWQLSLDLNVAGTVQGSLLGVSHMGKHKGGKGGVIVNVASIVAFQSFPTVPVYTASKHAVVGFTRCMASHYEKTGVRFLMICPGVTLTALFDNISDKIPDFVTVEEVKKEVSSYPSQAVDGVANGLVQLIEKGENGATWVCEGGEPPFAIKFPAYKDLGVPV